MAVSQMTFNFEASYAQNLDGLYVPWEGDKAPNPKTIWVNEALAKELSLSVSFLRSTEAAQILTGGFKPESAEPLAQAYAGHQFGGFSPQLGDGRALLLGELRDTSNLLRDVHLKGSGRTPFSRGGDGKAAIGPVLRECLMGEAMHALGISTTRALAALTTGEDIMREAYLPGAVLARVAASHIRVGTFQYFAVRSETEKLKRLADYAILRHDQNLVDEPEKYLKFLTAVIDRQCATVAKWMSVGFVHGVMNTDNTSISGETIDYGPCAFIDSFDPKAVFSSIDEGGRYAFGNQTNVIQWNLTRFAESLLDLIDPNDRNRAIDLATYELKQIPEKFRATWLVEIKNKLGLIGSYDQAETLIDELHNILENQAVDYTLFFRALAEYARANREPLHALFIEPAAIANWLSQWSSRVDGQAGGAPAAATQMDAVNPIYIPRNHLVEQALAAATAGDYGPFEELMNLISHPFQIVTGKDAYARPPPLGTPKAVTFCGT